MDYVQIAIVVGLMALGGGLVFWPCSLQISHLNERVKRLALELEALQQDAKNLVSAAASVVDEERTLAGARDPAGAVDFGVLLDDDIDPTAPAGGKA